MPPADAVAAPSLRVRPTPDTFSSTGSVTSSARRHSPCTGQASQSFRARARSASILEKNGAVSPSQAACESHSNNLFAPS